MKIENLLVSFINHLEKIKLPKKFKENLLDYLKVLILEPSKSPYIVSKHIGSKDLQQKSKEAKLRRFLDNQKVTSETTSSSLVNFVKPFIDTNKNVFLIIDRTNYEQRSKQVNILTLSLRFSNGIDFPILWKVLDYKGNSSFDLQKELLNQFITLREQTFLESCKIIFY